MELPRVLIVPYLRNWSYDLTAQALREHLSHRFDFRLAYEADVKSGLDEDWPQVVVDMWWHGTLHMTFGRKTVKQISSHRWSAQQWGRLTPSKMLHHYAKQLGVIVVPSRRLLELFSTAPSEEERHFLLASKGFDPAMFFDQGRRLVPHGADEQLSIGWAGASAALDKHVDVLLEAAPNLRMADQCLTYDEMPDFYNGLDIIACASDAEGDPRPLIEAMACGCFPITTDVGIVPELIRRGENGFVVDSANPAEFAMAFEWCRNNIDHVRAAGRRNAVELAAKRRWSDVAPMWGEAIDLALARSS